MSNRTPANIGLTTNTNPTTPIKAHNRVSQQTITNRSFSSCSSTYPPPPNSDMVYQTIFLF